MADLCFYSLCLYKRQAYSNTPIGLPRSLLRVDNGVVLVGVEQLIFRDRAEVVFVGVEQLVFGDWAWVVLIRLKSSS